MVFNRLGGGSLGLGVTGEDLDREAISAMEESLGLLAPLEPGSIVTGPATANNVINLGEGAYKGLTLSKDDTIIRASSAGAVVSRASAISGVRKVSGVTFRMEDYYHPEFLISFTGATGRASFTDCIFERSPTSTTTMFSVETGWKINFTNCWFLGGVGIAAVFTHGGPIGNIQINGGFNLTGAGMGTATLNHVLV